MAAAPSDPPAAPSAVARALPAALAVLGALQLAQGLWMAAAPRSFYDALAAYPPYNAHFIGDLATLTIALGAGLLAAARLPAWRVPVLAVATLQFALHALNHAFDVGEAETTAIGVFGLVTLTALTALLALLLRAALRASQR